MPTSWTFQAIGTSWAVEILQPITSQKLKAVQKSVARRIESFDKNYSRFRDDSLVATMATKPGRYKLPPDAKSLLDLYERLYKATDGLVTPLIGDTLAAAGYDASYSLQPKKLTRPPPWETALKYRFPYLTTKQAVLLDFGAAGKGYLVDIVADILSANDIQNFLVDGSGDMVYRTTSTEPRAIALENPIDTSEAIGIAKLHNQSLCGSAGNRRSWGQYHHIINPQSLVSPRNIQAVWAVADSCLLADGLTTALYLVPAAQLVNYFEFEYAIVYNDTSLEHSANFPAEFFTLNT